MMYFEITDEQIRNIRKWDKEHECSLKPRYGIEKYAGAIGGSLTYEFIPTSIGTVKKVRCTCGKEYTYEEL